MTKVSFCLWFDNQALEAAQFYLSVFKEKAKLGAVSYYGKEGFEIHGQPEGKVMLAEFEVLGHRFQALNGGPLFKFNESFSVVVTCEDQKEVDYYWNALTDGGQESACGWLKDKYGLSWQVVPKILEDLMKDPKRRDRVMAVFLKMKKFEIENLLNA